jgi:hypothetical protein
MTVPVWMLVGFAAWTGALVGRYRWFIVGVEFSRDTQLRENGLVQTRDALVFRG